MGRQIADHGGELVDREVDRQGRAGGGETGQGLALGQRRGAAGSAGQHQRLRRAGQGELGPERGGGGGEGRHARRDGTGDALGAQAAQLFAQRRPDRQIAAVQAGDVVACRVRAADFRHDRIEVQRRRVDDARSPGAVGQDRLGHQRSGVQADRAGGDQVAAAQGQQVGRAGAGADKVHAHKLTLHCTTG